jgi:dTDP-4-dehydrorhamnose reductase
LTKLTKIMITGGSGKLGKELLKVYPDAYAPTSKEMNITEPVSVCERIFDVMPQIIIHTAAITDTQICEYDWKRADLVNITGTFNLAYAAEQIGAKMVYISTACVFDGENAPFDEDSKPAPKNHYAVTKLAAEYVVNNFCTRPLIIRTNFVAKEKWPYQAAFTDRFGSYLFAGDVACAIKHVLDKDTEGTIHVCGDQKMSMYELAKLTTPDVEKMTMADYHGGPLTRDMTLISNRIPPFHINIF